MPATVKTPPTIALVVVSRWYSGRRVSCTRICRGAKSYENCVAGMSSDSKLWLCAVYSYASYSSDAPPPSPLTVVSTTCSVCRAHGHRWGPGHQRPQTQKGLQRPQPGIGYAVTADQKWTCSGRRRELVPQWLQIKNTRTAAADWN
eukprot:365475-Chlamydomonas_euryale.AAC.3